LLGNARATCREPERLTVTRESVRFAPGTGGRTTELISRTEIEFSR
jgi:hypothetical protein